MGKMNDFHIELSNTIGETHSTEERLAIYYKKYYELTIGAKNAFKDATGNDDSSLVDEYKKLMGYLSLLEEEIEDLKGTVKNCQM